MPYLSDAELSELARIDSSDESLAEPDLAQSLVPVIGSMGAATVVGFVRSKLEDPNTGEWNVPGTKWDAEAVVFGALLSVALWGQHLGLAEYRNYAAFGAVGVGSHFAGEVARRFGKTGKLDFHVGGGVPPWDPTSFDPTQNGDPYADPQARGLSASGV
jgi:hypothetical protein